MLVFTFFNPQWLEILLILTHALGIGSYRFSVTKQKKLDTGRSLVIASQGLTTIWPFHPCVYACVDLFMY